MSTSTPSTQTVTEKSDPWSGAQPYITDVLSKARDQSNAGGQYYPFSTVVPFSDQTKAGLAGYEGEATTQAQALTQGSAEHAHKTLAGDYKGGTSAINKVYDGGYDVSGQSFDQFRGGGTTPADSYLGETASGEFLNSNPHLDSVYDKVADRVTSGVGAQFSNSGMFGSTNHAGELADSLGDAATDIYAGNYARERQNQLSAAGTIQGAFDNSQGRALSATGAQTDIAQRNADRGATAAGILEGSEQQERNRQVQLTGLSPQLSNAQYSPYDRLMQSGQMREEQAGRTLEDAMSRHNFEQQQPWNDLANYSAIINGYSNIGGQSTQQSPLYRNRGAGLLGGAATGASLGSIIPGLGTGVGAAIGGLGGLLL